jgi:2-methylcitrate dehydratase PrpD
MAALLAKEGLTSDEDIMQGHGGFMAMFHDDGQYVPEKVAEGLGEPFHLVRPGASIRKYPCPMVFQGIIDSLLDIRNDHRLAYEDVDRVIVEITPFQLRRYDDPRPVSGEHAKFSLNFVLAAALRHGSVRQEHFPACDFLTPQMEEAIGKIELATLPGDKAARLADPARYQPEVRLRAKGGREISHRVKYPRGRYDDPAPKQTYVVPKFRDNARSSLSDECIARCIDLVKRVDELERLDPLSGVLRGDIA